MNIRSRAALSVVLVGVLVVLSGVGAKAPEMYLIGACIFITAAGIKWSKK